jgi:hypothetical protein
MAVLLFREVFKKSLSCEHSGSGYVEKFTKMQYNKNERKFEFGEVII